MRGQERDGYTSNVYSMLYATLLLFLIIAVLTCNLIVIVSLLRMHKRQKSRRVGSLMTNKRERISMSEEIDHLILLSIMTIAFIICSVPFTVRAYINRAVSEKGGDDTMDLLALRFLSINSIIDPWIFTVLRPSVLRLMRSVLCCRSSFNIGSIRNSPSLSTRLSTNKLNFVDTTYGISQKKHLADGDKLAWGEKTDT